MRQLAPGPRRRCQAVARGQREIARRVHLRWRDVDVEAQVGEASEQQAAVLPWDPLRIERAVHRLNLAPPCPGQVDRIDLKHAVAIAGEVNARGRPGPPGPPGRPGPPGTDGTPARRRLPPVAVRETADLARHEIEREQ